MVSSLEQIESELASATDVVEQMRLLNLLSIEYRSSPKSLATAQKAIALAVGEKNRYWVAEGCYSQGTAYAFRNNFKRGLAWLHRGFRLFEALGNEVGQIRCLGGIAHVYMGRKEHSLAVATIQNAIERCARCDDPPTTSFIFTRAGRIYSTLGDFSQSLNFYYRSLQIQEKYCLSPRLMITNLNNIGTIYHKALMYDKALQHYTRGLDIITHEGLQQERGLALYHIGLVHYALGKGDVAIGCWNESHALSDKNDTFLSLAFTRYYRGRSEFHSAEEYANRGYNLAIENNDSALMRSYLSELGKLRMAAGDRVKALQLFHEVLTLAAEVELDASSTHTQIDIHLELSRLYEENGETSDALAHLKRHVEVKEEYLSQEKRNKIAEVQLRVEIESSQREHEAERQRVQSEFQTARRIQEGLLPSAMPQIAGITISALSRPAQAVGGDYYDIIPLGKDRYLVIIADVSGKGLAAALLMAEFHGMVHVVSGLDATPAEMLKRLNEHLVGILSRGSFITASMLLLDTSLQQVTCARAGHTPIVRHDGREVNLLMPRGIGLGLCSGDRFASILQEETITYLPGDRFLLYSDGVSEAMNENREEFGEERLYTMLRSELGEAEDGLCERILAEVEAYRGSAWQNDDITIVAVNVHRTVATVSNIAIDIA